MFEKCHPDFAQAIAVDVFGTIVLRLTRSEHERIALAPQKRSQTLRAGGHDVRPGQLSEIRLRAPALGAGGEISEGPLRDIFEPKLAILGFPSALLADAITIKLPIEKQSLRPNRKLSEAPRNLKGSGKRITAASDTARPVTPETALKAKAGHALSRFAPMCWLPPVKPVSSHDHL